MKTMKWTQKLTAALFLALSMFTFTSCDDDEPWDYYNYYEDWYDDYDWYQDPFNYGNSTLNAEAAALRGYWTGTIEYQYYDHGQLQAETMYADFEFDQYNSNSLNGRGRETDYAPALDDYGNYIYDNDGNMVYDSQELRFAWYIDPKTGDISIKYDNSGYVFTTEWDGGFSLSTTDKRFHGVFNNYAQRQIIKFDLTRTTLAKPNVEFGADSTATSTGKTFGTRQASMTYTFKAPMKLSKR